MRKILSLFAAVLFAGSMFAVDGAIASAIEAGDQVVLINTGGTKELTAVTSGNIGTATAYSGTPNGTLILTVEAGKSGDGTFSFKLDNGSYLAYTSTATSSSNYLYTVSNPSSDNQKKQVSWSVEFNASNEATITNVYNTNRKLKHNNDRFCCYTSNQTAVKFFKLAASSVEMPTISPAKGSFQGSVEVTLACATDGASIYYTTDASKKDAPSTSTWTAYNGAAKPSFNATTTIYVAANKGTDWSNVATKTFTLYPIEMTCAAARTAALSVSGNNVPYADSLIFTVEGYVTSIQSAWSDGKISFWMADAANGGNVIEAFKATCVNEADAPVVGEVVAVTGSLTKYSGTPEFAAGCTFTIIPQPYITPAPTTLDFEAVEKGSAEPAKTFTLNGDNLTDANDITITAPTGFKVSVGDNEPANSITLNSTSGVLSATIKVTPVTSTNGVFEGNVTIATDDLDDDVTVAVAMTVTERFTVTFSTGEGNPTVAAMTETAVAAGITLPAGVAPQCTDWTFAGWKEAAVAPATTTAQTLLEAGSAYSPKANVTLYAVYSKTEGGAAPAAYTVGQAGDFVLAAYADEKWYALPADPTVNSGKITGVEITVGTIGTVKYVTAEDAADYKWTIAASGDYYTLYDGENYLYHSNGGNSGTNLATGTTASYKWSITSDANGLIFAGVNNDVVKDRGMLFNGSVFGGYALSNKDAAGYYRVEVLPISSSTTYYASEPTCTPSALDNAAVEGKAVKFIENGQLFIEKAGVRYNVMGQIIK